MTSPAQVNETLTNVRQVLQVVPKKVVVWSDVRWSPTVVRVGGVAWGGQSRNAASHYCDPGHHCNSAD